VITGRTIACVAVIALLAVLPPVAGALGQGFYIDLFTRVPIFGVAALSLDLILGYGGLVSFGHAAYLGIGAYAVGIPVALGLTNGFAHLGLAIGGSALAAALIGLVSLRSAGTTFIMITLAFAQMIYFLCESLNQFGGDNGLNIPTHSDFGGLVDLDDPVTLYYLALLVLAGALLLLGRLVESRFGMVLRAAKSNERRMAALGFPVFRYRLAAFVASGALCGVAGALLANQTQFLSPSIMHWTRSGEIMMMVILGGRHADRPGAGRVRLSRTGERALGPDATLAGRARPDPGRGRAARTPWAAAGPRRVASPRSGEGAGACLSRFWRPLA
jgi:branched-chain amino acid transport system permease protein